MVVCGVGLLREILPRVTKTDTSPIASGSLVENLYSLLVYYRSRLIVIRANTPVVCVLLQKTLTRAFPSSGSR